MLGVGQLLVGITVLVYRININEASTECHTIRITNTLRGSILNGDYTRTEPNSTRECSGRPVWRAVAPRGFRDQFGTITHLNLYWEFDDPVPPVDNETRWRISSRSCSRFSYAHGNDADGLAPFAVDEWFENMGSSSSPWIRSPMQLKCTEYDVDCEYLDEWADWSGCSATCGYGMRSRTKVMIVERSGHGRCDAPVETEQCHVDCTVLAVSLTLYCFLGLWTWAPLVFDASCDLWRPKRDRKSIHKRRCAPMRWSERLFHGIFVAFAIATLPVGIALYIIIGLVGFVTQCYLGFFKKYTTGWQEVTLSRAVTASFSCLTCWTCVNWERVCSGNLKLYKAALCSCSSTDDTETCVECCFYIDNRVSDSTVISSRPVEDPRDIPSRDFVSPPPPYTISGPAVGQPPEVYSPPPYTAWSDPPKYEDVIRDSGV